MTTLLIESNRAIANSIITENEEQVGIVDIRHKQVSNNANWSTTIDTGIELQPGDQISMQSCALNVTGAGGGDFLQFNGSDDTSLRDGTFKSDNRCEIVIAYYVNNNNQFNCPLPKGSNTIMDLNIRSNNGIINESFGSPDLTGKNIWGVNFNAQVYPILDPTTGNALGNLNTEFPQPSPEYYPCPTTAGKAQRLAFWAFNNEWSMNRNGYFSKELNPTLLSTPASAAGALVIEKQNTIDHFGYVSWCENTPQKGMTGVSFGQKNMSLDNTFNENINNRNKGFNRVSTEPNTTSGETIPGIDGGTAPYLIQSTNQQNNVLEQVSSGNLINVYDGIYFPGTFITKSTFLPQSYGDFETNNYEDIVTYYPTTYKGGGFNHRPNNNRLYCSELYDVNKRNQGPYYRLDTNNLVTGQPVQTSNLLNFRTQNRDTKYFHFLQSTIELDLGTGNLAPSRVAEIITDQMKERQPNMASPNNEGVAIGAEIFLTYDTGGFLTGPFDDDIEPVLKKNVAQLTSKTYTTYPTINGYCWNAKVTKPKTSIEGWAAIEKNQKRLTGDPTKAQDLEEGNKYNPAQAYEKFYANMLVGNPFEWKAICEMQPILQACPMTFGTTHDVHFNYENHSILAGFDDGVAVSRQIPTDPVSVNTTTYKQGNLGNFPCLLNKTYPTAYSANKQKSYVCSWYAGNFIASKTYVSPSSSSPVDLTKNYNIECLNCKNYQMYDKSARRPILDVKDTNVFATNIIFDGQLQLSVFDENMDKIKKHGNRFKPASLNGDSLESQSIEFFNNTYVDWIVGRIDDQYSYPENESMNIPAGDENPRPAGASIPQSGSGSNPRPPIKGREGTPIYLPNIFQTYNLYNGVDNIKDAANPATVINTTAEMKNIFSIFRRNVSVGGTDISSSGSYMMRQMRVGYLDNNHTNYNPSSNPQSIFNKGTSAGFYCPTSETDPVTAAKDADRYFGIPSWSTYADDFQATNNELTSAYKKGCRRSIECYRYLPQNKQIEYNVHSAFNHLIPLGAETEALFTTCPETYTFQQLKKLWDKITELNKGKGIGIIPIFFKNLETLETAYPHLITATKNNLKILETPFCGIIAQGQSYANIPVPELGEYIMLGTTSSLQQNDLHHPFTTQQSNLEPSHIEPEEAGRNPTQEYITNYCGIQSFKDISSAVPVDNIQSTPNVGKYVPSKGERFTRISANEGKSISNIIYVGANDPIMNFDTTFNRFALGNLHTQLFKGNGVFQLASFGPNTSPEVVERVVKSTNCAVSQQVDLPAGYFQKFDDSRLQSTSPPEFMIFNLQRKGSFFGRDRYLPGRVEGGTFGTGATKNRGLLPLQTNSIDGNVIRQTFDASVLGPGTKDPQAIPLPSPTDDPTREHGGIYFNNFEPGGLCSYAEVDHAAVFEPAQEFGFLGNLQPFVPFNATQFTLRLLNQDTIVTGKELVQGSFTAEDMLSPTLRPYAYIEQDSNPYVYNSAQAGIGIIGYNVIKSNGVSKLSLTNTDYALFQGSMFFKMGYELNQILPLFSQVQTQYNHTLYNKFAGPNKSASKAFNNMVFPVTTNCINGSSGVPSTVGGFGTGSAASSTSNPNTLMPMFNLGGVWTTGAVVANSDILLAERLPSRLSFPYLVLRSNIATPCGNQYIGGPNGQQLLPAISYLMTSYASDDYFYNYRSDLVFTVNKPYVLTELISSIHFPNGKLATEILGLNTAVIYRIDFAQRIPQIPQQIQEKEKEKEKDKKK